LISVPAETGDKNAARRTAVIESFEAHLRDQPDDLVAWSAYADYLSERGDPRGEFMAVQIALERGPTSGDERATLQRREAALLADLGAWLGPELAKALRGYSPRDHKEPPAFVFRRGWLHGLTLDHREYRDALREERERLLQVLARTPEARWVRSLHVPLGPSTAQALAGILTDPGARFLTALHLSPPMEGSEDWDDVDEEGAENLEDPYAAEAACAVLALDLGRVRSLSFAYARIGVRGVRALATSRLGALTALDLRYARIGSDGLAALARSANLANVTALSLQRNDLGEKGAHALAGCPHLGCLRQLDLRYNPLMAEGARVLAAAPSLGKLERLFLYREDVGTAGAQALAASAHLPVSIKRYWGAQ
jgi:uncharacterized protein (TIGR02996 family)